MGELGWFKCPKCAAERELLATREPLCPACFLGGVYVRMERIDETSIAGLVLRLVVAVATLVGVGWLLRWLVEAKL